MLALHCSRQLCLLTWETELKAFEVQGRCEEVRGRQQKRIRFKSKPFDAEIA